MPNSSNGLRYTEGIGDRQLATYRFLEDGVNRDVERIAPGAGVLDEFTSEVGISVIGPRPYTEITCRGKGRIVVKFRAATGATDLCSFYLVFKAANGSIIGTSPLVYAAFTTVVEDSKSVAVASVFSNDCCASFVYVDIVGLPQNGSVDVFIAAI